MKISLITLIIASLALAVAGPGLAGRAFALTPHEEAINTAIENGLVWLRANQNGGNWNNVGTTGLVILAFLDQGITEEDAAVSNAVDYILTNVKGNGSIYWGTPG